MFIPKGRKNLPTALIGMGRHLIYSEGIKTEPYYIESIKESIANVNLCDINDIEIVPVNKDSESYNTLGLVDYALNDIKKRLKLKEVSFSLIKIVFQRINLIMPIIKLKI